MMSVRSQKWHWIASHTADVLLLALLIAVIVLIWVSVT